MNAIARTWRRLFLDDVDPRPAAALRIATGLQILAILAEHVPIARDVLSDDGWLPAWAVRQSMDPLHWSILHWVRDPAGVVAVLVLGCVAATLMTLGLRSRTTSWIAFAVLASVQVRNPNLLYGGDAAIRVLAFYVALADNGAAWSIDALRTRRRALVPALRGGRLPSTWRRPLRRIGIWPQRLIQIQTVFVYWGSGVAKFGGASWQQGTALWYGLVNPMYSRAYPLAMPLFSALAPLWRLATWATPVWQFAFPFLLPFRHGRLVALGFGLIFHAGIVVMLRVEWFGTIMLIYYLAFLRETTMRGLAAAVVRRARHRLLAHRLSLRYDPADDADCVRASWIAALDSLGPVRIQATPGAGGFSLHAANGEALSGKQAVRALAGVVPLLTPLGILAALPGGAAALIALWRVLERAGVRRAR